MKTALVLEGGALRTIYSSGVCDAFLDGELPLPDYTLGVSAGIAYGVSYLSRQSRRRTALTRPEARCRFFRLTSSTLSSTAALSGTRSIYRI